MEHHSMNFPEHADTFIDWLNRPSPSKMLEVNETRLCATVFPKPALPALSIIRSRSELKSHTWLMGLSPFSLMIPDLHLKVLTIMLQWWVIWFVFALFWPSKQIRRVFCFNQDYFCCDEDGLVWCRWRGSVKGCLGLYRFPSWHC